MCKFPGDEKHSLRQNYVTRGRLLRLFCTMEWVHEKKESCLLRLKMTATLFFRFPRMLPELKRPPDKIKMQYLEIREIFLKLKKCFDADLTCAGTNRLDGRKPAHLKYTSSVSLDTIAQHTVVLEKLKHKLENRCIVLCVFFLCIRIFPGSSSFWRQPWLLTLKTGLWP